MMLVQRLVILVALVLAPITFAEIYNFRSLYAERETGVRVESARMLVQAKDQESRIFLWLGNILTVASIEAPRAASNATYCTSLMASIRSGGVPWTRVRIADASGTVRCSSEPSSLGTDMRGSPEFDQPMAKPGFHIGDVTHDAFSDTYSFMVCQKWTAADGASGVICGRIAASWFVSQITFTPAEGAASLLTSAGSGRIVSGPAFDRGRIMNDLPDPLRRLSGGSADGVIRLKWFDGSDRIVAYAPFGSSPLPGLFLAVGIDRQRALSPLDAAVFRTVILFGLTVGLSIVGTWWIGRIYLSRPIVALANAVGLWKDGDRTARVRLPGRSELSQLGGAFDEMADSITSADRAARASADLLDALADSSSDCIYIKDTEGRFLFANSACECCYGVGKGGLIGIIDKEAPFLSESDRRVMDARRHDLFLTKKSQSFELNLVRPDGSRRCFQTVYSPLFDEKGEVVRIACISRDTTEQMEIREHLRAAKEDAEEANRLKTSFLAAASHDLRQPLQGAILYAGIAADNVGSGGVASEAVSNIGVVLSEMKGMLDSLLDVSQLEAGGIEANITDVALEPLIEAVQASYSMTAAAKGLDFVVHPSDGSVRSDPTLLARMVRNIVENAIRYTESGRVTLGCIRHGATIRIQISDTGVGIDKRDMGVIWEGFRQLANPERDRSRGVGLGLAIVHRLSVLLGHPVSVVSEPGRGSCFTIEVPALEAPKARTVTSPEDRRVSSGDGRFAVVVDDDAVLLEGLRLSVASRGYRVLAAHSGGDALAKLSGERTPDVVVADYRLRRGETGAEVILAIREVFERNVPGIILTGEHGDAPKLDAETNGFLLLRKPVLPAQLMAAIDRQAGSVAVSPAR